MSSSQRVFSSCRVRYVSRVRACHHICRGRFQSSRTADIPTFWGIFGVFGVIIRRPTDAYNASASEQIPATHHTITVTCHACPRYEDRISKLLNHHLGNPYAIRTYTWVRPRKSPACAQTETVRSILVQARQARGVAAAAQVASKLRGSARSMTNRQSCQTGRSPCSRKVRVVRTSFSA